MAKTKIFRTFTENLETIFRKIIFHEISQKSFSEGFLTISKFSENSLRISRKNYEFYNFAKFSKNFATILVNRRFRFC